MDWIRRRAQGITGASIIWKAITQSIIFIKEGRAWQIGNGEKVRLGIDAWSGCGNAHILPLEL